MDNQEFLCRIIAARLVRYANAPPEKRLAAIKDAIELLRYIAHLDERERDG